MNKPIEAPAVVHGPSKESQMKWFQDSATDVKLKYNTVQNGKGSRNRSNTSSTSYQENYDSIFRKPIIEVLYDSQSNVSTIITINKG